MQNVLRYHRPDDKTDDQKRKQNALGRNNRRERDVLRGLFSSGEGHHRRAGVERKDERTSWRCASSVRISSERKRRHESGEIDGEDGGGESERGGFFEK